MPSKIEWTEETWNPVVGCDKISAGCRDCYAIRMAWRLAHIPKMKELYGDVVKKGENGKPNWTGVVKESESALDYPLRLKNPTVFFVDSMSDLFHAKLSIYTIAKVFAIMYLTPHHTYQILTKRADRLLLLKTDEFKEAFHEACNEMHHKYIKPLEQELYFYDEVMNEWPLKNVWLGVSVEDQKAVDERIPFLLQVPASVRFLSCEPLIERITIPFMGTVPKDWGYGYKAIYQLLHWVICGGESGPDARPMHPDWVRSLQAECEEAQVPFLFKQWGSWVPWEQSAQPPFQVCQDGREVDGHAMPSCDEMNESNHWDDGLWCAQIDEEHAFFERVGKKAAGRKLDGKEYNEYPESYELCHKTKQ